jgi:hypothetical protein
MFWTLSHPKFGVIGHFTSDYFAKTCAKRFGLRLSECTIRVDFLSPTPEEGFD